MMNKKVKITALVFTTIVLLGAGGAYASNLFQERADYEVCMAGEQGEILKAHSIALREISGSALAMKYAQEARDVEHAAQVRCTPKSSAEIQKIVEDKKLSYEESTRMEAEDRKNGLLEPRKLSSSELGIGPDVNGLSEMEKWAYTTNSWTGYLEPNDLYSFVRIIAGNSGDNPLQGKISLTENVGGKANVSSGEYKHSSYLTPTATGPVKILSENNGVLKLQSIAGTFNVYDSNTGGVTNKVTAPGGIVYSFDLRTHILY